MRPQTSTCIANTAKAGNYKECMMKDLTRRDFLSKSMALGVGVSSISLTEDSTAYAIPRAEKDDISIAQWALVNEIRQGKWTTLEFPRVAREAFDINGIEFVSTLFGLPT